MKTWMRRAGILSAVIALSACSLEVLNPGRIQDGDLNTPDLLPIVVNGVSAEYNDIGDIFAFTGARMTDDAAGTGSYFGTQVFRQGIFDWDDAEGFWEQAHEAAWAAEQAWERMQLVLEGAENSDANAAKLFALMGHAYLRLGENFCDAVFDVGPAEPRSAFFDAAIDAFDQAITIGTAAGDADHWVTSARAGTAAAYVGLGNLGTAVTWANQVPTDYVDNAIYHQQANSNQIWIETWNRAEIGVYRTLAQGMADGYDDPRVPYTVCGEWNDETQPYGTPLFNAGVTPTGDCTGQGSGAHQGADGEHAHYRQDKYPERGSDIPRATGVEMRLIEAEAFMMDEDFVNFMDKINELRAFYEDDDGNPLLPARTEDPATMVLGQLDWPYAGTDYSVSPPDVIPAADDAWSILDEERYATLWMTGKRLHDLDRWDHPFLDGGWIVGSSAEPRRVSCMPVPRVECDLNPNLENDPICTG